MRVKETKYEDEDAIIIYISKNENENEDIQNKIKDYKKKCKHIAIFVSGDKMSAEEALTRIIQYEYNKED